MNLQAFESLSQKERETFSRICNLLLSSTYVMRESAQHRITPEYSFIDRNFALFSDYLELCGWRIYKDSQYGVIYLRNTEGYNKLNLSKLQTVILICLRILYEEQRVQANNMNDVCVTVGNICTKIVNEYSVYPKKPPAKELKDAFRLLESHHLIEKLDESYDDMDCRLLILPSVIFAVPNERAKAICDTLKKEQTETEVPADETNDANPAD